MRYQERIYPQTNVSALRNRDINIFNMSTDICVFNAPSYYISGATILDCTVLSATSVSGYSYVITGETETIPLGFVFTANTDSLNTANTSFNFRVFKYQENSGTFSAIPKYTSNDIYYSALTNSATTQLIPSSGLTLDGEYIIKGYYKFPECTYYMNKLGKTIDTYNFFSGNEYGIYNKNFDFYFAAINVAATPEFAYNASNTLGSGILNQVYLPINYYTILPDINQLGQDVTEEEFLEAADMLGDDNYTIISLPTLIDNPFILTLNGLVLAKDLDYTYTGGTLVYMNQPLVPEDIVTVIYTTGIPTPITNDVIEVLSVIPSGATDGQGTYSVYYNTTTSKYELFTSVTPSEFNSVLVMINGVMLANGVDFYQSTTNAKRIILSGNIVLGDVITISYFSNSVNNNINTSSPVATWTVEPAPDKVNGYFTLELASDINFNTIVYTATTDYYVGATYYNITFDVSGYGYGDRLFYRIRNDKNYETICGNIINTYSYSEIIPITIATNSVNSY